MHRHRAGRLAVLLSLKGVDARPDGVARTAYINPSPPAPRKHPVENGRSPSTVGLMAPSGSENSMESSDADRQTAVDDEAVECNQAAGVQADRGLEMNIDIVQAASVLRFESNGYSNNTLDEDDILETGLGGGDERNLDDNDHDRRGVSDSETGPPGSTINSCSCGHNGTHTRAERSKRSSNASDKLG